MKLYIALLLSFSLHSSGHLRYEKFYTNEGVVFLPISRDIESRFDDQDICEILYGVELSDCGVSNEGSPSPEPEPDKK